MLKKRNLFQLLMMFVFVLCMGCSNQENLDKHNIVVEQAAINQQVTEDKTDLITQEDATNQEENVKNEIITEDSIEDEENNQQSIDIEELKVHFIDVEQGDSIFIQSGEHTLLIDAGENDKGDDVVRYLKNLNISKIDYVIGTHPHSDHIGGLDYVIESFQIGKVILPFVEHSTKTYEDVLDAISNKGLKITKAKVGNEYDFGGSSFEIIAPHSQEYADLNDYSVGVRLVHGDTSFVFVGDADAASEEEMVNSGMDISADVLKLNHHGSKYSNCEAFLDLVDPKYTVISVGRENSYGHPHAEVLEELKARNIPVYRTDLSGTIVITSDGSSIEFNTTMLEEAYEATYVEESGDTTNEESNSGAYEEETIEEADEQDTKTQVYVTKTGTKYHKAGCQYLKDSKTTILLEDAKEKGYTACSRCY